MVMMTMMGGCGRRGLKTELEMVKNKLIALDCCGICVGLMAGQILSLPRNREGRVMVSGSRILNIYTCLFFFHIMPHALRSY